MLSGSRFLVLVLALVASTFSTEAFVNKAAVSPVSRHSTAAIAPRLPIGALSERRWNFNEGQAPWGLKKNAEIWNGRVSQVLELILINFTSFLQETPISYISFPPFSFIE